MKVCQLGLIYASVASSNSAHSLTGREELTCMSQMENWKQMGSLHNHTSLARPKLTMNAAFIKVTVA